MRIHPSILILLLALSLIGMAARSQDPPADAVPATDEEDEDESSEAVRRRVIVRETRHREIAGFVELEDAEVIVIRDRHEDLHSFAKGRLLQIVHLNDPQPGQSGLVVLRDGQLRRGLIIEDGFDHVIVEIEGIRTRIERQAVDYVLMEPTMRERYERFKATVTADTPQRHMELCRWLVDEEAYDLAVQELQELLSSHPLPEARDLLRVAQAHLALQRARSASGPEPKEAEEGHEPAGRTTPDHSIAEGGGGPSEPIISHDAVNIIRVYEISFQRPPRVAISKRTIERMIERYGSNPLVPASREEREALFREDPLDIVKLLFDLRARDLYGEIDVLSEPYALNQFRQRVHNTWLLNNCATSRCHGGDEGGRFFLHRRNYKDERVRYTNLLILERLSIDPEWPLINYDDPQNSLIIQYALPRDQARKPHPEVRGWSPSFRSLEDRLLGDAVEWMKSMYQPRPEYPVEYDPAGVTGETPTGPAGR